MAEFSLSQSISGKIKRDWKAQDSGLQSIWFKSELPLVCCADQIWVQKLQWIL